MTELQLGTDSPLSAIMENGGALPLWEILTIGGANILTDISSRPYQTFFVENEVWELVTNYDSAVMPHGHVCSVPTCLCDVY